MADKTMATAEVVAKLVEAAERYDRIRAAELADELIAQSATIDPAAAKDAFVELRDKRWFDLLRKLGAAFALRPGAPTTVRKLYAQALIEQGELAEAMSYLDRLVADCAADRYEHKEARGLLGRAYKQAYIKGQGNEWLEASLRQYHTVYLEDPCKNLWHGMNAAALLSLAAKRNVPVSVTADFREIATQVLKCIQEHEQDGRAHTWDYATAAEACIALERWDDAVLWLKRYLPRTGNDVFEVGSTLRQLQELWHVSPVKSGKAAAIVHLLQADLLRKENGATIQMPAQPQAINLSPTNRRFLQKVLGDESFVTLDFYRLGLERSRNVARIGTQASQGLGTGFLVKAADLDPKLKGWLLITNAHVIPERIRPEDAVVLFESLDRGKKRYRIEELVWSSPSNELDATILRLDGEVQKLDQSYPIVEDIPPVSENARVYVIGHPRGGTLQFSISDNLLLDTKDPKMHYRTPTEPGSSGSPVFYGDQWQLVALHHAGEKDVFPRLHGEGTYSANEGIFIGSIIEAFRKRPAKKPKRAR